MKISEVMNCSFASWYPKFKKHTIKSKIIPLPEEFVKYLLEDGVVIPAENIPEYANEDRSSDYGSDDEWDEAEGAHAMAEPSFPELETDIKNAIRDLGGKVFPKLNWSCPRDAYWIALNTGSGSPSCCTSPGEIYLLLKSSDLISHDLTQPFKDCEDIEDKIPIEYCLVLKKWVDLNSAFEFRCFVKNDCLIAICQRDCSSYFDFISKEESEIIRDVKKFFTTKIRGNFPETSYVFDIHRKCTNMVILVDFNPFGKTTDGLLFNWSDLEARETNAEVPEFRYVSSEIGVQPDPRGRYGYPQDFLDLQAGEDAEKFIDFMNLKHLVQKENETDEVG